MDKRVLNAALAGLLHDVGKFAQRTAMRPSRIWDEEAESEYKYEHAVFSGDFVERYLPAQFKPLSPPAYHHAPKTDFDRLIQLADHLSAKERDDKAIDRARNPKQLRSVFTRLTIKEKQNGQEMSLEAPNALYYPLKPLELSREVVFPTDTAEKEDVADLYKALWDGEEGNVPWQGFVKEADALRKVHDQHPDPEAYLESLLALMQRYTWCIPSAYYHNEPDISLYDHSRITAAIAACLTAHKPDKIQRWLNKEDTSEPVAQLVGGDFSGIQDFIYTITSKGAASALRGRSLYLQLLTEAMARYLLRELGLPITNLIQVGGGKFFLLAWHDADISKLQTDISRKLLALHGGDLYVALAGVPLTADDFDGDKLSGKWNQLSEQFRHAKLRKFGELGGELRESLFTPSGNGNEEKTCQVCGREDEAIKENATPRKCRQCASYEELGRDLREAQYLRLSIVAAEQPAQSQGDWQAALRAFRVVARLDQGIPAAADDAERGTLLALSDEAFKQLKPRQSTAIGRRYLVNVTPKIADSRELDELIKSEDVEADAKVGHVKPVSGLARDSEGGFKRLGVLRMDVDNMGKILSEGLGKNATFSRLATLSFMFSLFFEGWTAELARRYTPDEDTELKRDRVYSIYSGGDDLFFVGSWDVLPQLALDICNNLHDFVAAHPGIHASGGIALVEGKYPLYQAAEEAYEALEDAKGAGKNAITFLSQTVTWDDFAKKVAPWMEKLKALVKKDVPRSLLTQLEGFYLQYTRQENDLKDRGEGVTKDGKRQTLWGPWHWRSAYQLQRAKLPDGLRKDLQDQLSGEGFQGIRWLGLAARWAAFLTRGG